MFLVAPNRLLKRSLYGVVWLNSDLYERPGPSILCFSFAGMSYDTSAGVANGMMAVNGNSNGICRWRRKRYIKV